ncbi:MAG TPA: hypothetical protein VGF28_01230 [Thermoanaerobaculia bacterium]
MYVVALSVLLSIPATAAEEESLGTKILNGAVSSAGSKGGEFAVKFVAGWIYNISCKPEQQTDEGSKALCSALGGVSGKSEEEWKAKVEGQLREISSNRDAAPAAARGTGRAAYTKDVSPTEGRWCRADRCRTAAGAHKTSPRPSWIRWRRCRSELLSLANVPHLLFRLATAEVKPMTSSVSP